MPDIQRELYLYSLIFEYRNVFRHKSIMYETLYFGNNIKLTFTMSYVIYMEDNEISVGITFLTSEDMEDSIYLEKIRATRWYPHTNSLFIVNLKSIINKSKEMDYMEFILNYGRILSSYINYSNNIEEIIEKIVEKMNFLQKGGNE